MASLELVDKTLIRRRFHTYRIEHECSCFIVFIYRVVEEEIKCEVCRTFYRLFVTSFINSIIQGHEC